jgi:hypothetical protein
MSTRSERPLSLRAGELVEVRSLPEILATLDRDGRLDGLPFMPEMLQHCGKRFRVFKSAHKTCDTINKTGGRRMDRAVHLENLRCDGAAHGGCEAGCLLFWKEAWLRRVEAPTAPARPAPEVVVGPGCTESDLRRTARRAGAQPGEEIFACQATDLFQATAPLRWWDPRHYLRDLWTGNVGVGRFLRVMLITTFNTLQSLRGGGSYPRPAIGTLTKTPSQALGLQPGERVQIRNREEIAATLDVNSKNRGLWFDIEMTPFCGRTVTVQRRVERIVNERTGRMMRLPGDCIVLDGVSCSGDFSAGRLFCPRDIQSYWREIWLKRVESPVSAPASVRAPST